MALLPRQVLVLLTGIVTAGSACALLVGCSSGGGAVELDDSALPLCRNYEGTANDSGYPCRINHSDGSVEILRG
jgi:hypothetical protein